VGVDPVIEERKKVVGGFEILDMGGAGIRDESKWVVLRESTSKGNPFGKGIKDIAEGILQFLLCVSEIQILGKKGKVLIASMATSFVVVSPLVRPDLIAKSLYAFPFVLC
jgi:hypothetical protein